MLIDPLEHLDFHSLTWTEAIARIFLACVFGFIVGYDRNSKHKPVDFRVFMIVCVISCMVAIMSLELHYFYRDAEQMLRLDLGKIIEGVLVGIGFLGAGAIIQRKSGQVMGTATAASIWASGGVGLMLGFGLYSLSILAFATLTFILVVLGRLRKPLFNESEIYHPCEDGLPREKPTNAKGL